MKNNLLLFLLLFTLPDCLAQDGYPVPPETRERLFYIQHSKNHNTYVYDANLISSSNIKDSEPIDIYQIDYKKDGTREELSILQRKMAYGIDFKKIAHNKFEFTLAAYPAKSLLLTMDSGRPVVTLSVNGKSIVLNRMFLHCNTLGTGVSKIDLYGKDAETQQPVAETLYVDKS